VIKCPQHFEQLPAIMRVHPDALVVFTHRDPIESLQSIVTQIAYAIRTRERKVDPDFYLEYWSDRVQRLLESYVRDVELVPASQRVDVSFADFVRDDMRTVEQIYAAADLPMTPQARSEIEAYRNDHTRGKYGAIDHDLERDFGVDLAALRERFDFYTRRVPLGVA
jgi:Sulfotransferase family